MKKALALLPAWLAAAHLSAAPAASQIPDPQASAEPLVTVDFDAAPLNAVLATFADVSGRSFVVAPGAEATVTARIRDQPWGPALDAILDAHGLRASEAADRVLIVGPSALDAERPGGSAPAEPLETRVFRIRWSPADDLADVVGSMLSGRGRVAVANATNALVVTDEPAVLARVASLLGTSG